MAITTFVGQNFGASEHERAKKGAKFGILSSMIMAESIGLILFIIAPYAIALFDDTSAVVAVGVKQMRTECFFFGLLAFSHCVAAVCRGSGRAFVPMLVMLIVWCGIRILYLTIMRNYCDVIDYIFWAYPLTWSISSIIYILFFPSIADLENCV